MHENKRRRKYICILRHVLGNLRIILYRNTRDRLICSHAIEQWDGWGAMGGAGHADSQLGAVHVSRDPPLSPLVIINM